MNTQTCFDLLIEFEYQVYREQLVSLTSEDVDYILKQAYVLLFTLTRWTDT